MAVMASWNGKTWGVSSQRIAALNGISHSVELDTENSDDKAGSPATRTKALKLQSMSFDFDLAADVEFLVETYEPRVQLSDSDLKALTAQTGDFELRASIENIT